MSAPIVVTGGAGFLGRSLVRQALASGIDVVAPSSGELDVRDRDAVLALVGGVGPAAVVHLAYRAHEADTIVEGSANIALAAAAAGARLVHLSTDVVFAGRPAPYRESDGTDPVFPYGEAKAGAELAVSEAWPAAVLVRTSLLYRADRTDGGAPVHAVVRALADPGSFTFFTDEVRCPAPVDDVAAGVLALATSDALAEVSGPIHLAGPDPLSRADFATRIARWLGADPGVLRTGTQASLGLNRPGTLILDSSKAASLGLRCRGVAEVLAVRPRSS